MSHRKRRVLVPCLTLVSALVWQASAWQESRPTSVPASQPVARLPILVEEIKLTVEDKPIRGWAAKIDLSDPRVDIRVTAAPAPRADDPPGTETHLETTPDWLRREALVLAVNTHFFARIGDTKGPLPAGTPIDLVGPCVSEGRAVSPSLEQPSPVLALTKDRQPRIGMLTGAELDGMDDVVCGIGQAGNKSGGLLVEGGRNTGATALPRPQERHPRTAAGISADGQTLILVVIDGRQPEWSIGMTLPELADLMIKLGADAALNLDGGGSSSFVFAPPGGVQITNRPSDGHWRAVGASMGVRLRETK